MNTSFLLLCLANVAGFCFAIKCDFRYAEDDKNYPEHIIDSIVDRTLTIDSMITNAEDFHCEDSGDKGTSLKDFTANRFDSPISSAFDEDDLESESLCTTTKKTIRPKALPSVADNKLLTIINHGDFLQTVTIDTCTNENKPCQFDQNFPLGYTTKCKQKYQTHTIKTLNAEKTAIVDGKIYYPSACDCKVFMTKNLKNRF